MTVLTGFLGAGKTTLLNRILGSDLGGRSAVVENELGEVGVDAALIASSEPGLVRANNGCACCTVRGDLVRLLSELAFHRDRFDRVLIETTGLAHPGPVVQAFFADPEVRDQYVLDGVVAVVDAQHVLLHCDTSDRCELQIATADRLVLSKCDRVEPEAADSVERRLRAANPTARILRAVDGDVPARAVLDVGGFDIDRALAHQPSFLEPAYPFEWSGIYQLEEGTLALRVGGSSHESIQVALVPVEDLDLRAAALRALRCFTCDVVPWTLPGRTIEASDGPGDTSWNLVLRGGATHVSVRVPRAGRYALFTEHRPPAWFDLRGPGGPLAPFARHTFAGHRHDRDREITSVGIHLDEPLHPGRLRRWLGSVAPPATDIVRLKGMLSLLGHERRYLLQGVHSVIEGRFDRAWGPETPASDLVVIGRHLDRAALVAGLESCTA